MPKKQMKIQSPYDSEKEVGTKPGSMDDAGARRGRRRTSKLEKMMDEAEAYHQTETEKAVFGN